MLKNKDFLTFKLLDVVQLDVFILLINVKMLTIVGIFNIFEHDKCRAELS